jgi:hypothetical protein
MTLFDRMIAAAAPPNCRTTQRRSCGGPGEMRMGAMMRRDESNLTLMLIVGIAALVSLGTILVRTVGPAEKGITANAAAIADLRGSLP